MGTHLGAPQWDGACYVKPRLLDLYAGAGGAAVGYHRAGFEVIGVDHVPQPNYPFTFNQDDALGFLAFLGEAVQDFDAIHASPPCHAYTSANRKHPKRRAKHPALIGATRKALQATGLPYVIENVPGARRALIDPVQICGRSLGIGTHRHRLFECPFPAMVAPCSRPDDADCAVYGKLDGRRLWTRQDGAELRGPKTLEEAQEAMGIDWMTWDEFREAIPPVFTEDLGFFLMAEVRQRQNVAA